MIKDKKKSFHNKNFAHNYTLIKRSFKIAVSKIQIAMGNGIWIYGISLETSSFHYSKFNIKEKSLKKKLVRLPGKIDHLIISLHFIIDYLKSRCDALRSNSYFSVFEPADKKLIHFI